MYRLIFAGLLLLSCAVALWVSASGTVVAQDSTADEGTLSGLSLQDEDGDTVTLTPAFSATTTDYSAAVFNDVRVITVSATTTGDDATVEYLGGGDSALEDADDAADGHQVPIWVGDNTIKVKVTTDDGATETYTIVVTRNPPATTLVKNTHLSSSDFIRAGQFRNGRLGQRFTTGSNAEGYGLSSVRLKIRNVRYSTGETVTVSVHKFDDSATNDLGDLVATLTTPTLVSGRLNSFVAPPDTTLSPDTEYIVSIHSTGDSDRDLELQLVWSDGDTGSAGWQIDNSFRRNGEPESSGYSMMVEVRGFDELTSQATTDATLSHLSLEDADEELIELTPEFRSTSTVEHYTASVSYSTDEITIAATTTDDGANVEYLDADDAVITDSISAIDGMQIPLSPGANTIKAKVTAQDRTTTQTYTIVVRRQTPSTVNLVRNTHLPQQDTVKIGKVSRGAVGQRFTTGSHQHGYALKSVGVKVARENLSEDESLTVRVHEFDDGATNDLGEQVAILESPSELRSIAVSRFTASSTVSLEPDTEYIVNFHSTGNSTDDVVLLLTNGNGQGGATGWTIEDSFRNGGDPVSSGYSMMIDVRGYAGPDTTGPVLSSADVNGDSLVLTYDEVLATSSVPSTDAYSVSVNGGTGAAPASVSISGSAVTLTLASAVSSRDAVTVSYTVPSTDLLRDLGNNAAGPLADQAVTNSTPDTMAPVLSSATVDRVSLVLTYDEELATSSVPATGSYSVSINGGTGANPSSVSISGSAVTLTLASEVSPSDEVTVSYTVPGRIRRVRDLAENAAAALTDQAVTNIIVPGTDATLNSLALSDADRNEIALDPAFGSATTSYSVSVRYDVAQVTVSAGTADSYATLEYLDDDDATIADANNRRRGQQVALSEGDNTIGVRVTAEDGVTTETYTVVVTRAAEPMTLVSNAGQPESGGHSLALTTYGQPFDTGSHSAGYSLHSVNLMVGSGSQNAKLAVTVRVDSNGEPGNTLHTLTRPETLTTGLNEFIAPQGATLEAETTYWVVAIYETDINLSTTPPVWQRAQISDGLDSGTATGWDISGRFKERRNNGKWRFNGAAGQAALKLQVKGTERAGSATSTPSATTTATSTPSATSTATSTPSSTTTATSTENVVVPALTISGEAAVAYPENATYRVANYTVTGAATGTTIIWTLTGVDDDDFSITWSGELFFRNPPDYERPSDSDLDNVYEVTVNAYDWTNTATFDVMVVVGDKAEAPNQIGGL